MIQQCSLTGSYLSATYQCKSLQGAIALLVLHEPQHQAWKDIEREGGGGVSRRLNHWHGEPALKRVHASLHNYPLCIETTSIIKDADSGLISTSKNGSWSVTEHRVHGQSTTSLGWLRFITTLILFVKFKMNECVTNILKGSLKISMAHQWMSAGIVHGVWDHRRIMKIHAHVALPGLFPFSGYVGVLAVVLRTNNNSPWTEEFDSKGNRVKTLHANFKKRRVEEYRFVSVPQRSSYRVWLSQFQQPIPESNGRRLQMRGRVMCTSKRRSRVTDHIYSYFIV